MKRKSSAMADSEVIKKTAIAPQNDIHFNPCITGPFGAKKRRSLSRENSNLSKKNVQHWLRLQEVHHRLKDCEDEEEKMDLYINFGDRLCDLNRFTDALCAYGQAFVIKNQNPELEQFNFENLFYFAQSIGKLTAKVQAQLQGQQQQQQQNQKRIEIDDGHKTDFFLIKAGEPSYDPLSCPFCFGVIVEPVTLPCGHTYCRSHVINTANPSLCIMCKAPWRRQEPRLICTPSGELQRQQTSPEEDLKKMATNTAVNTLVHKYWSNDLKVSDIRTKANKFFGSQKLKDAMKLYNEAFQIEASNVDYMTLGNRSITYLKMGQVKEALEDAEKAIEVRSDWPKGYLRKAMALRVMGSHNEAFKAFYDCLTLDGGQSRPAKLEVAKELFQLLKSSSVNVTSSSSKNVDLGRDSDGDESSCSQSDFLSSSNTSLSEIGDYKPSDLPQCLLELGSYLDYLGADRSQVLGEKYFPEWLLLFEQTMKLPCRPIDKNAIDATDFECPLCMRLLWNPTTTPCGHTFCKVCLDRVLDHNTCCPMCKSATLKSYLCERSEKNVTEFIEYVMKKFLKDEYEERRKIHEEEMQSSIKNQTGSNQIPVFVCTLSYPSISCPLHVFEPRYRLMIRRCMESGTRQFGMCGSLNNSPTPFADYGTMLEIRDIQFFEDGRSIVDCIGGRRFKVLERGIQDGYNTAKVDFLEDEPVDNEHIEELKQLHDDTLCETKNWFEGSADHIRSGIVNHYGGLPSTESNYWTLPNGPSWSWWILNILPVDPALKIKLLSITSLKKRLENIRRILKILEKAKKPRQQNNCSQQNIQNCSPSQ